MNKPVITQAIIIRELAKELNYMQEGGTTYRIKTTKLALEIAKITTEVKVYANHDEVIKLVLTHLPKESQDRVKDVAKMLHVIFRDLQLQKDLLEKYKLMLADRKYKYNTLNINKSIENED